MGSQRLLFVVMYRTCQMCEAYLHRSPMVPDKPDFLRPTHPVLRFQVLTKHPYHVDMRRSVRLTPARLLGWLCLWEAGGTAWGYVHISDFGIQPKASSIALASKGGRDAISVAAIGIAHPDVAPVCPLYLISLSLSLSSLPLRQHYPLFPEATAQTQPHRHCRPGSWPRKRAGAI